MNEPLDVLETRRAYDTVAVRYGELLQDLMIHKPYDRAILAVFAERVLAHGHPQVLDAGCGTGRIAGHLTGLGLQVRGIDVSPGMVEVARTYQPHLDFSVGSLESLALASCSLGGLVAWYSLIHTPPERLPAVLADFARVLMPGGMLVLAFQVGDAERHIDNAYGHEVSLHAYLLNPERMVTLLREAGFAVESQLLRIADTDEAVPQAYLLASRL